MRTINGLDELRKAEGEVLGTSDWYEVTQADVDAFADVTGDHQWIHVDVERAKETPFGGTIAHGYFTLSLIPLLSRQVFGMEGFTFALNYGLNRVRFVSPVKVGSKIRMRTTLQAVDEVQPGVIQLTQVQTVEIEGADRPALVAESLTRLYL